ncbi:RNA polymerase factor sigma-54 [candidate division KSB1 bacterium]
MVRLEQRLSLQQRLSPQHVLFSTLLQMPVMALEQKIKTELEQNPLLEEAMETEQQEETAADPVEEELKNNKDDESGETEEPDEKEDFDIDDFINDEDNYDYTPSYRNTDEEDYRPDPAPVSLSEYLLSQFHFLQLSEDDSEIGEYIIWNINEDGYLSTDTETIADNLSTQENEIKPERIEAILKMVQLLDPVGIGARTLQECLLIQLREKENPNKIAITILEDNFNDFKNKRYEKLVKNLGGSIEEIKKAIGEISRLNPKPGEGYINTNENYIVPDLIVEKVGNEFIPSVNDGSIPHLRINNAYRRMLTDGSNVPEETKKYIHQRLESARWLINSIQQRKITMVKVMKEIIARQRDFFEKGQNFIKPMILKDIADAIGMDISTISRVTNGKYVQTDYGVFELKYYFSDKMKNEEGEEISTLRIKSQIKEIIDDENPKNPLTDGQIAEMVAEKGIPLARRTVAKYREQMKIPVARLRRQI